MNWLDVIADEDLADGAAALFRSTFGGDPDGVWIAPGRVNLIGEHIDYAGGLVLPFALPYATAVAVRRREDTTMRAVSTHTDRSWTGGLGDVGPGNPSGWAAYVAGVSWALQEHGVGGVDVAVHSSVPVGSGLSSSAALECSFALALDDLFDLRLDRKVLIEASICAENEIAGASTGGMDQNIAMSAERGHALLLDCLDGSTRQIPLDLATSGTRLLVIDTNAPHRLVDGQYGARRAALDTAYAELGVTTLRGLDLERAVSGLVDETLIARVRHVATEIGRVEQAVLLLDQGVAGAELGELMTASHTSLRDDYEVSSPELDSAVDAALRAGAHGARMTGGGFGGSAIALVPSDLVVAVADEITSSAARYELPEPTFLTAEPAGSAHRFF
ncbi:galactokinase [Rhodococcus sp. 05-339-2]|uniref:galactokinase n=1 Tax=Rhodococcoides fascians TaxID=1828 RepID=UPI00050CB30C|nr:MULTISPECIES: galactokinase [Rhodococcus]OZD79561.1 galactokinase [Rhodococcus sp. 05-339-2]